MRNNLLFLSKSADVLRNAKNVHLESCCQVNSVRDRKSRETVHLCETQPPEDVTVTDAESHWLKLSEIIAELKFHEQWLRLEHFGLIWLINCQLRRRSLLSSLCACMAATQTQTFPAESHTLSFLLRPPSVPSLSPAPCWSNYVQCVSLLQAVWGWLMMLSAQGTCFNVRIISLLIYYIHWIGFNHY